MTALTPRYMLLRDARQWDDQVTTVGLEFEQDGVVALSRLPHPADGAPILLDAPYMVEASGVAVGTHGDVYLADTEGHRVIWIDAVCQTRMMLPGKSEPGSTLGQFNSPRGLLVIADTLYVADSQNARVQLFRLPTLELRAVWTGYFHTPTGLASDSQGNVYVLDRGLKRVLRFSLQGVADEPYDTAMVAHPDLAEPAFIATNDNDELYVSDEQLNTVVHFDRTGRALGSLPKGSSDNPSLPRALVADGNHLYVADADNGRLWVYEQSAGAYIGTLPGYRGPVAAMTVSATGALYIKPGVDDRVFILEPDRTCATHGYVLAGPYDAGEETAWARVSVQAEVPNGADLRLQVFTGASASPKPFDSDWYDSRSLDTLLVAPSPDIAPGLPITNRYLWVRVLLTSDDQRNSPRVSQVQAETASESYLRYLPSIYERDDKSHRFLERWLALYRAAFSDWENTLEEMPCRLDPVTAPEESLHWLASWLGFELPADLDADEWRDLLLHVRELYERRGTPSGLREFVKLYTGVRPDIFEAFRERRIWQLGETSMLGFDTSLAPFHPDRMIVPGFALADPQYQGLRADYYKEIEFDTLLLSRTDPVIDSENTTGFVSFLKPSDRFSVRWTGQVLPRYSETYTFYVLAHGGVRLWVDGRPIIDNWSEGRLFSANWVHEPAKEHLGRIELATDRWFTIQLEYCARADSPLIRLWWASRSQQKEIVPQSRSYSVRDETASFESPSQTATMLVGQTVVGESGPLKSSEFGLPLFCDKAHLFTISIPAARAADPRMRAEVKRIIETEKPAHTDFHLCFVEARMRVGFQARIGIDSIVAGPPEPLSLEGTVLGIESFLGDQDGDERAGRLGSKSRVGIDTIVG